ncbi:MAG: hypothetical protein U0S12_03335 [Fimbriimonadales bacterium]
MIDTQMVWQSLGHQLGSFAALAILVLGAYLADVFFSPRSGRRGGSRLS